MKTANVRLYSSLRKGMGLKDGQNTHPFCHSLPSIFLLSIVIPSVVSHY